MNGPFFDTAEQQAIKLSEENIRLKAELAKAQADCTQFFNKLLEIRVALMGTYDPDTETELMAIHRLVRKNL